MERSTSENDLKVAPRSTPEQQGVVDLEFVELEDAPVNKAQNISEENMKIPSSTSDPPS